MTVHLARENRNNQSVLYTAKIESPKLLKKLESILDSWEKTAKTKDDKAQKSKTLSSKKKELSDASSWTISILKKCVAKGKYDVYVAYDSKYKVQAVATKHFARLYKKRGVEIRDIATNPDNVVIFGTESPIRGAGTSVVKHIVYEMKSKKHKGSLHLSALNCAVPFYKKLGFLCEPSIGSTITHVCELSKHKRNSFLKTHSATGSITHTEPEQLC